MSDRFAEDEYVVYGKVGVCRIVGQQAMTFGENGIGEYYVLAPQNDPRSSIYVPCDNPTLTGRLRRLMSKEEIDALLSCVCDDEVVWVEDKAERAAAYRAIVSEGDRRKLLHLIRCLHRKKQEKLAAGKHFSVADENTMQESMRLLEEEFAVSLQIPRSGVPEYIRERLEAVGRA